MIPSQGGWPALVSNGDSSSVSQTSNEPAAPITQVKILRRPRPHESQSQSTGRVGNEKLTASNMTSSGPNGSRRKHEQAPNQTAPSIKLNEDEWPSIADAESKNFGSQKQKYNVLMKPSEPGSLSNGESSQTAVPQEPKVVSIKTKPVASSRTQNYTAQYVSHDSDKIPKAPIKTYQERADEYAKARLRILGSAFAEEDKVDNDDKL